MLEVMLPMVIALVIVIGYGIIMLKHHKTLKSYQKSSEKSNEGKKKNRPKGNRPKKISSIYLKRVK